MAQQMQHKGGGASGVAGVFHSRQEAESVAHEAVALGVDPLNVRIGGRVDEYRAIRSEMQEELEQSWISPQAGVVYPKESAKGLAAVTPVAVGIGILILLPFAAIPISDFAFGWRLLIMAAVGAALGFTVGLVVGPSIAVKRPNDALAAERGVVVRVSPADEIVEEMMATHDPIRLDRFVGEDLEVVETEDLSQGAGLVDEVDRNLSNPKMEADPGYRPEERGDDAASADESGLRP